jgi:uncharacterized protein (TIGR02145 family)
MAAKDYKLFDGANWISPCDQEVRMLMPDGVTWRLIDPNNEDVKYFDGSTWKLMECEAIIDCTQGSLSGSGGSGIYYIPMVVGASVCDLSVSFNIDSVPDSLTILNFDKSVILAQTGYFGISPIPTPGTYSFGPGQSGGIYQYSPGSSGNFLINNTAPVETLNVLANQFPITNTNPLDIPISIDPANPSQTTRTTVWNKGATATDVNILIRVVGHPTQGTGWSIQALTCINCSAPIPPSGPCFCRSGEVVIGTQTWACENLNVTQYRNGDTIPQVTSPTAWAALTTGAWCHYNNDPANDAVYGKLYNHFAVRDSRGLAPFGYHVPTATEWDTLENYLGGSSVAGGKLKQTGTANWNSPNTGATNSTCFSAVPGGRREFTVGAFSNINIDAYYWTSSIVFVDRGGARVLHSNNIYVTLGGLAFESGCSVRVIKD